MSSVFGFAKISKKERIEHVYKYTYIEPDEREFTFRSLRDLSLGSKVYWKYNLKTDTTIIDLCD